MTSARRLAHLASIKRLRYFSNSAGMRPATMALNLGFGQSQSKDSYHFCSSWWKKTRFFLHSWFCALWRICSFTPLDKWIETKHDWTKPNGTSNAGTNHCFDLAALHIIFQRCSIHICLILLVLIPFSMNGTISKSSKPIIPLYPTVGWTNGDETNSSKNSWQHYTCQHIHILITYSVCMYIYMHHIHI